MSSSPRTRPSTDRDLRPRRRRRHRRLVAGRSSVLGVDLIEDGENVRHRALPADRGHRRRAREIRDLYTIVFLIAVAIFFVVEGLIIWTVIRYRRKPGDDTLPPQTHGNNIAEVVWTIVPTIIVVFLFVISWQTLNAVDTVSADAADQDPRGRRPVPVEVRLPRRRRRRPSSTPSSSRSVSADGGMIVPAGRTVQLSLRRATTSSTPSTSRSSCSSATSSRVGPTSSTSRSTRPTPARRSAASAPSCAAPATAIMLFEVHALTAGRLRRLAGRARSPRPTPRRPRAEPAPSGQPAPSASRGRDAHGRRRERQVRADRR